MCYSTVIHCKVVSRRSSDYISAAKVSIILTEKYYFHIWWIAKYILFYKPEPTVSWLWSILDYLSTFEYIEIMMMFWSMDMICDFRVSISWRFKLCKLSKKWYAGLYIFYKESMCLRHDSWNEMYIVFKAWGISIWTLNVHRSEVHSPREIIHGLDSHEVPTWVRFPWGIHEVLTWVRFPWGPRPWVRFPWGAYLG